MTPGVPYGTPSGTARPGDVIAGRYRIEAEIGQGGFGAVYRATHIALGRAVALKMLKPELVSHDQGLSRFRREAELAQRLEHPNTVRLYDFGQTEVGLPYIAFELLRGEPLDQAIMRQGSMPPARVVRIVSQVLKSLMEAHSLGIIHRDIKPGNIFICEFPGETDFAKVLDFGIAKSTSSASTLLTQVGHSIGTPNYMSPEQVRGEPLTPAADVYSVGLMMAEMLSGKMVFTGAGTDVCLEQLSPNPVPLPPLLLQSPLHRVLTGATQKEKTHRYQSAGDMLRALDEFRTQQLDDVAPPSASPLQAAPPPTAVNPYPSAALHPYPQATHSPAAYAPLSPMRPRRGGSSAPLMIGLALALVVGATGAWMLLRPTPADERPRADRDSEDEKPRKKKPRVTDEDEPAPHGSVKRRLEKLGWKITSETTTTQPTVKVTTVSGQKGSQMAIVYVYEAEDNLTSEALETSLSSQKGSAVKRDGHTLYWVLTVPEDRKLASSLIDDLDL